MTHTAVDEAPGRERHVGKVTTRLEIVNAIDDARAELGEMQPDAVRRVVLDEVLVDTGATTLGLPASVIARLGLRHARDVLVRTASGERTVRLFRDAAITVMGRTSTFDCLELPDDSDALLGVVPLEMLGLEPDLANQRLRVLPDDRHGTYLFLY